MKDESNKPGRREALKALGIGSLALGLNAQQTQARDLLVLKDADIANNAVAFFGKMNSSQKYREEFVINPAGAFSELSFSKPLSEARVSQGNRLFYSLLSNSKFMDWAHSFQERYQEEILEAQKNGTLSKWASKPELYKEVAKGILENSDLETMYSVLISEKNSTVPEPDIVYVYNVVVGYAYGLVYTVAAVVLYVVIPFVVTPELSRLDLQALSNYLSDRMSNRGQEMRQDGSLLPQ